MRAVVFDWDGTLVDSESLNLATWVSQLAAVGYQPSREELDQIAGRTFPDCLSYFSARATMDVAAFERGWRAEIDRRVRAELVIFKDSVACLKAVRAAGIPVAVATQTPRHQLDLGLRLSRLASLVTVSVCREDVARPKPAPDVYLEACARLGLPAGDCLAVEDSPVGARSARSAGLAVLGVARAPGGRSALAATADVVVDCLDQDFLLSMLAEPGQTPPHAPSGSSTNGAQPQPSTRDGEAPMAVAERPDVFISYNSDDTDLVQEIVRRLSQVGLRCWLDLWALVPGQPWQEDTESALLASRTVLVAVGRSGFGRWHREELRSALALRVEGGAQRRVVPVLLPGVPEQVIATLPPFLRRLSFVDMRGGITGHALARLAAGCRGQPPGMISSTDEEDRERAPMRAHTGSERRMLAIVEASMRAIRRWAQAIQNRDGGIPSDNEGTYSCAWSSAGLLWSLAMAGEDFHSLWIRRGLTWVLDNRNPDGGSPVVSVGDPSITEATAQAALACLEAYRQTEDSSLARESAALVGWLLYRQEKSAGWSWRPGTECSWTVPTAFSMLALDAAQTCSVCPDTEIRAALAGATEWIVATRNSDCGWGSRSTDESRPAVTGLVMYVLAKLGHRDLAREALDFLCLSQHESGHWPPAIDRPLGRSVIRFGDAYGVLGLASCASSLDTASAQLGIRALMTSFSGRFFRYQDTIMHSWPTRDGLLALSALATALGSDPKWQRRTPLPQSG